MRNQLISSIADNWIAFAGLLVASLSLISKSPFRIESSSYTKVNLTQYNNVYQFRKNPFQRMDKYSLSYVRLNIVNQGPLVGHNLVVTATLPDSASFVGIRGFTHFQIRNDYVWREIGTSSVRIRDNEHSIEVRLDRLPPNTPTSLTIYYSFEFQADTAFPNPTVIVYGDDGPATITKQ